MRNCVSEMTNHGAKASGFRAIPQGNRVVCDGQKDPVCLDTLPGAHKHLGETEMLFDVLVKEFDRETLRVKPHHFGLRHIEIVGHEKPAFSSFELGDKDQHRPHVREKSLFLCGLKPLLFGDANGLVFPRSLCQVTRRKLLAIHEKEPVGFDRRKESPACGLNGVEDRGARIPDIHEDGQTPGKAVETLLEDFPGEFHFAFESFGRTAFLGAVSPDRPGQRLGASLQNRRHGTEAPNRTMNRVMVADAFDVFALPGTRRIVQNHEGFFAAGSLGQLSLMLFFQALGRLGRVLDEVMKTLRVALAQLRGDFPDRSEFHKPNQAREINQKVLFLRLGQNFQEWAEIRRNLFWEMFSHGFRVLRGLVSIGDFDRKPFCFQ